MADDERHVLCWLAGSPVLVSGQDIEDASEHRWYLAGGKGPVGKYAARAIIVDGRQTTLLLHRWVAERMGLIASSVPQAGLRGRWVVSIDHANGDKLDCQRPNLRLRDRPQQMRNPADGLRSTNRSGFRGVSYIKSRVRYGKPWMAYVTVNYKTANLGWFVSAEDAARARAKWERAHDR